MVQAFAELIYGVVVHMRENPVRVRVGVVGTDAVRPYSSHIRVCTVLIVR